MRMHRNAKTRLIRSLPLFADCTASEVARVAAIADEIQLASGRQMTRQDADGGEFVVICAGTAEVQRGEESIADLGSGDFFGEIALLNGVPRTATVVATSPVRALVIEGHAFLSLLENAPSVRDKVEQAATDRLVPDQLWAS